MIIAATTADLRTALVDADEVVLVPTMGALHDGHATLLSTAREQSGRLVASIFVNPLQFAPGEDLARYPRTFEQDVEVCRARGVDVIFAPDIDTVYPGGEPAVTIEPGPLGAILEGAVRPGHFRGVLTVVAKLFGLVRPDAAFFGEKDYQQLVLIRQMVTDLCMQIDVRAVATARDYDGLALSSRNRYLSAEQRVLALALSGGLRAGAAAGSGGGEAVLVAAQAVLASAGVEPDYLALRSTELGDPPSHGDTRLLVAARVGTTRLLDNAAVTLG